MREAIIQVSKICPIEQMDQLSGDAIMYSAIIEKMKKNGLNPDDFDGIQKFFESSIDQQIEAGEKSQTFDDAQFCRTLLDASRFKQGLKTELKRSLSELADHPDLPNGKMDRIFKLLDHTDEKENEICIAVLYMLLIEIRRLESLPKEQRSVHNADKILSYLDNRIAPDYRAIYRQELIHKQFVAWLAVSLQRLLPEPPLNLSVLTGKNIYIFIESMRNLISSQSLKTSFDMYFFSMIYNIRAIKDDFKACGFLLGIMKTFDKMGSLPPGSDHLYLYIFNYLRDLSESVVPNKMRLEAYERLAALSVRDFSTSKRHFFLVDIVDQIDKFDYKYSSGPILAKFIATLIGAGENRLADHLFSFILSIFDPKIRENHSESDKHLRKMPVIFADAGLIQQAQQVANYLKDIELRCDAKLEIARSLLAHDRITSAEIQHIVMAVFQLSNMLSNPLSKVRVMTDALELLFVLKYDPSVKQLFNLIKSKIEIIEKGNDSSKRIEGHFAYVDALANCLDSNHIVSEQTKFRSSMINLFIKKGNFQRVQRLIDTFDDDSLSKGSYQKQLVEGLSKAGFFSEAFEVVRTIQCEHTADDALTAINCELKNNDSFGDDSKLIPAFIKVANSQNFIFSGGKGIHAIAKTLSVKGQLHIVLDKLAQVESSFAKDKILSGLAKGAIQHRKYYLANRLLREIDFCQTLCEDLSDLNLRITTHRLLAWINKIFKMALKKVDMSDNAWEIKYALDKLGDFVLNTSDPEFQDYAFQILLNAIDAFESPYHKECLLIETAQKSAISGNPNVATDFFQKTFVLQNAIIEEEDFLPHHYVPDPMDLEAIDSIKLSSHRADRLLEIANYLKKSLKADCRIDLFQSLLDKCHRINDPETGISTYFKICKEMAMAGFEKDAIEHAADILSSLTVQYPPWRMISFYIKALSVFSIPKDAFADNYFIHYSRLIQEKITSLPEDRRFYYWTKLAIALNELRKHRSANSALLEAIKVEYQIMATKDVDSKHFVIFEFVETAKQMQQTDELEKAIDYLVRYWSNTGGCHSRGTDMLFIVKLAGDKGFFKIAIELIGQIQCEYLKDKGFAALSESLCRFGNFEWAEKTLSRIKDDENLCEPLINMAFPLIKAGKIQKARHHLNKSIYFLMNPKDDGVVLWREIFNFTKVELLAKAATGFAQCGSLQDAYKILKLYNKEDPNQLKNIFGSISENMMVQNDYTLLPKIISFAIEKDYLHYFLEAWHKALLKIPTVTSITATRNILKHVLFDYGLTYNGLTNFLFAHFNAGHHGICQQIINLNPELETDFINLKGSI